MGNSTVAATLINLRREQKQARADLQENKKIAREIREKSVKVVYDTRMRKQEVDNEILATKTHAINEMFDSFVNDMRNPILREQYISGRYSGHFTKFVARRFNPWSFNALNDKHRKAIDEYNNALENLNATFVSCILADVENCKRIISRRSGLKNIDQMEEYISTKDKVLPYASTKRKTVSGKNRIR